SMDLTIEGFSSILSDYNPIEDLTSDLPLAHISLSQKLRPKMRMVFSQHDSMQNFSQRYLMFGGLVVLSTITLFEKYQTTDFLIFP
ncbi:hypothetical protein ACJX0J_012398, partial [Zea mays]